MNIFTNIREEIITACEGLFDGVTTDKVTAEPPKDASHGDIATNAAMVLAGQLGQKPREIAEALRAKIETLASVEKVEIAGPGFINITLKPAVWQALIPQILNNPETYGDSDLGRGQKVNVEYVSANPTGPMHVGHGRAAVMGDTIARLLAKAGYEVTKEYYINDGGAQIDTLLDSAYLRYREACGEPIGEIKEGLYPGDYLVPTGEAIKAEFGEALMTLGPEDYRPKIRELVLNSMMQLIKDDLAQLGIHHDVFTSEAALTNAGRTDEAIEALSAKGLIYEGVLEAPKGKAADDWEPTKQTLFKSSAFGDDSDRAVKKSDGSWAYFAPDIALHYDKIQRGFNRLIDVFGADHGGYVKRITSAVKALAGDAVHIDIKLCQMVRFLRRGTPVKMSKRAGTFITVREVVDEVGKDVFRFIMLTRNNDAPLDFDFDLVKEQTRDNPVFYVQYAHARAKSVLRHAAMDFAESVAMVDTMSSPRTRGSQDTETDALDPRVRGDDTKTKSGDHQILALLNAPAELDLLKTMAAWPRVVEAAAISAEPHRIAFYLADLAAAFHSLWNKGNDNLTLRFLQNDAIDATAAKIAMVEAFALTVASGLNALGVQPLEEL